MKKIFGILLFLILCAVGIYAYNFIIIQSPINKNILEDERNNGVSVIAHYKYFVISNTLVFNIKKISSDNAPIDIFRIFLQSAEVLKNQNFERVDLASKGKTKFFIKGDYFKTLGLEYGTQNPVYTIRTFPENLFLITGEVAYDQWTGGIIGVASKQMEDFTDAYTKWFLDDFRE